MDLRKGTWFDHEAGQGGGTLSLVQMMLRLDKAGALAWLRDRRLLDAAEPAREPASTTIDLARRLWAEAVPAASSPVAAYLASRGLTPPPDAPLRFHPACPRGRERWPAMVALMSDPASGEPCGVHRTFLARGTPGKAPGQAKMMAGHAGVIRLVPDAEITTGLGLAEGIETSLSVMQAFDWRPVWAAASAGGIAGFPVLPGVETLTIFADSDDRGTGLAAARRCAAGWHEAGREVRVMMAPAGMDFHDAARGAA